MKENENRIGYYSVIPATVLYNKELKANEKLLYAIITSLACKEGYCFASNEYLAEKLGVNRKTVSSWITHLEEKKFIIREVIKNENQRILKRKIYLNVLSNLILFCDLHLAFQLNIHCLQNNILPYMH